MGRNKDPRQLSLDGYFSVPPTPEPAAGTFEFEVKWRRALNRAIKESGKSRPRVAAEMTELIFGEDGDREITKAMLDARTAPSRDAYAFPVTWLPAFVIATGAPWLLDLLADLCGCKVLKGRQAIVAQLGAALLRKHAGEMQAQQASQWIRDVKKVVPPEVYEDLVAELQGDAG